MILLHNRLSTMRFLKILQPFLKYRLNIHNSPRYLEYVHNLDINKPSASGRAVEEDPPAVLTPQVWQPDLAFMKKSLTPKQREILQKQTKADKEADGFQNANNKALKAFVHTCIHSNEISRAHLAVFSYLFRVHKKYNHTITDPDIFALLFHAMAKRPSRERSSMEIKSGLESMEKRGLEPNLQCYAAFLEALQREKASPESIRKVLDHILHLGYQLEDLIIKCHYVKDELNQVLQAVCSGAGLQSLSIPRSPAARYTQPLLAQVPISSSRCSTPGNFQLKNLLKWSEEQAEREKAVTVEIDTVCSYGVTASPQYKEELTKQENLWKARMKKHFMANRENFKEMRRLSLWPFLHCMDVDEYVALMIQELRTIGTLSESYSPNANIMYTKLGIKVASRFHSIARVQDNIWEKTLQHYRKYLEYFSTPELFSSSNPRCFWQHLSLQSCSGPSLNHSYPDWPGEIITGVGHFLYRTILRSATLVPPSKQSSSRKEPPYFRVYRKTNHKTFLEIKPNPNLIKLYQPYTQTTLNFEAELLPMLSPPIPWTTSRSGGYLKTPLLILRQFFFSREQLGLLDKAPESKLAPTLDSLNILGLCPWIINKPILDLMLEIFRNNGDMDLGIPPPVENVDKSVSFVLVPTNHTTFHSLKEIDRHSLWCSALYLFSVANHYRDRVFWFPHNIDFRGRTYPVPPHLNHLGSDLSRAMLLFAKGKPLGPTGLRWLKLHLVNLSGMKKRATIPERLSWVESQMPEILDSADRPLTGRMWWSKCEEPWQALAVCREISLAARSGQPASYICHLPIHQDGSCNGLQHYAALGRDKAGAQEVNLAPNSVPGDIYSTVAEKVEEKRQKDLQSSCTNTKKLADSLTGHIHRKTVKQPVMTVVYGVTLYGAKLQVKRKLKDIPELGSNPKLLSQVSDYVARNTLSSLGSVFTSTQVIQAWLTHCAQAISKFIGQPVCWETPLSLPVVQPYRRKSHRTVSAVSLGSHMKELSFSFTNHADSNQMPHVVKQKNAFPANFIHSLDATHMNLTSLHCHLAGLTFVSVHDCFWTHPGVDTEIMNQICREQFIALHSQPILEDLSKYFIENFAFGDIGETGTKMAEFKESINDLFKKVPPKGDFELEHILNSPFFFS